MLSGNKGEWSEVYVLLKLLSEHKLFISDENLNQINEIFYPIISIVRRELENIFTYKIDKISENIRIEGNNEIVLVPIKDFVHYSDLLLSKLHENKSQSFEISELNAFLKKIKCFKLKADSFNKTDITIKIHDPLTGLDPSLGFSIKSQLGSPATLLNASKKTNFLYLVNGIAISESERNQINEKKIKKIVETIYKQNGCMKFLKVEDRIFNNNMLMIDSRLPEIIGELILGYYRSEFASISDGCKWIVSANPLNFDLSDNQKFYEYKIKHFLTDVALGMVPSCVWSGDYDANGGYLIVKEKGEIMCFHIYKKKDLENYLFNNTKFDTPSTTRHQFGIIEDGIGGLSMKLNLQIRFIK